MTLHHFIRFLGVTATAVLLSACTSIPPKTNKPLTTPAKPSTQTNTHKEWAEITSTLLSKQRESQQIEIDLVHDGSLRVTIPSKMIVRKSKLNSTLHPSLRPILKALADELQKRPHLFVSAVGHNAIYNNDLQNQAESLCLACLIAEELINNGVQSERIHIEARGATSPLVSAQSSKHRAINRRIELYIHTSIPTTTPKK